MGTAYLFGLKISNINPMSSRILERMLGHPSKEKELKIGGTNHFLTIGKDDRFKSSVF